MIDETRAALIATWSPSCHGHLAWPWPCDPAPHTLSSSPVTLPADVAAFRVHAPPLVFIRSRGTRMFSLRLTSRKLQSVHKCLEHITSEMFEYAYALCNSRHVDRHVHACACICCAYCTCLDSKAAHRAAEHSPTAVICGHRPKHEVSSTLCSEN